jgi:predicted transglutaminase-like cysteine proteinase
MFKKTLMISVLALSALFSHAALAEPSIASKVESTSVTSKVYKAFCAENPVYCAAGSGAVVEYNAAELAKVNKSVNTSIKFTEEKVNTWTIAPKAGDCEDYALTKMVELMGAGYPRSALKLAMVKVKKTGEGHMVLTVETTSGTFVLDNMKPRNKKVYRWDETDAYTWVAIEEVNGSQMGFKRMKMEF